MSNTKIASLIMARRGGSIHAYWKPRASFSRRKPMLHLGFFRFALSSPHPHPGPPLPGRAEGPGPGGTSALSLGPQAPSHGSWTYPGPRPRNQRPMRPKSRGIQDPGIGLHGPDWTGPEMRECFFGVLFARVFFARAFRTSFSEWDTVWTGPGTCIQVRSSALVL